MATVSACEDAVGDLVRRLADVDPVLRRRYALDRSVSCRVSDLDVVFAGRLCEDGLVDVHTEAAERAQVRLTVASEDLVALAGGRMALGTALASGRLRVQAGPLDLLKLRALL